jgi:1-aminocyclopropane-1-carboxylate deaminase/D-cysteine desulfhydrase-like pyridoxal-dependent ACC family enzyme
MTIALFEQYPKLREKLPYISLGILPTPVQKLERLGNELHLSNLYIKRDDMSGAEYGGNKIRKLEFILGQALREKAKEVITFGGAGSNHALATTIYSAKVGLKCISILMDQPNARYVRKNLLMSHHAGAELHFCKGELYSSEFKRMVDEQLNNHYRMIGCYPYVIPVGGSSTLGVIGYVNAAFELAKQISNYEAPKPDLVYVAAGTLGTAAGLILGFKLAGLATQVVSVRVTPSIMANKKEMLEKIKAVKELLASIDSSLPSCNFYLRDIDIRGNYYGREYALFTKAGMQAIDLIKNKEGINLDGTYTGKTFAAIINDARKGKLRGKKVLFWNTLNSNDFSKIIASSDYHNLPHDFHRYFVKDVQKLDVDTK